MSDDFVKMDYKEHERTYSSFIRMSKYAGVAVIAILVLMAFFLL